MSQDSNAKKLDALTKQQQQTNELLRRISHDQRHPEHARRLAQAEVMAPVIEGLFAFLVYSKIGWVILSIPVLLLGLLVYSNLPQQAASLGELASLGENDRIIVQGNTKFTSTTVAKEYADSDRDVVLNISAKNISSRALKSLATKKQGRLIYQALDKSSHDWHTSFKDATSVLTPFINSSLNVTIAEVHLPEIEDLKKWADNHRGELFIEASDASKFNKELNEAAVKAAVSAMSEPAFIAAMAPHEAALRIEFNNTIVFENAAGEVERVKKDIDFSERISGKFSYEFTHTAVARELADALVGFDGDLAITINHEFIKSPGALEVLEAIVVGFNGGTLTVSMQAYSLEAARVLGKRSGSLELNIRGDLFDHRLASALSTHTGTLTINIIRDLYKLEVDALTGHRGSVMVYGKRIF